MTANWLCVSHSLSPRTVCVSLCVCLAVTGEFPDSADPDEWVTVRLCVHKVHVCQQPSRACFLINVKHSAPQSSDPFLPQMIQSNTHAHNMPSDACRTITMSTRIPWCFTMRLLFHLLNGPTRSGHGSFMAQTINHWSIFLTHIHPLVAVCSVSRHATVMNINRIPGYCGYPD